MPSIFAYVKPDTGLLWGLWTAILGHPPSETGGIAMMFNAADVFPVSKLTVSYSRAYAGQPAQDAAMTTHHFIYQADGDPGPNPLTSSNMIEVEGYFDTFWGSIASSYQSSAISLSQYQWRQDGPAYKPFGASLSPTVRTIGKSLPGSAGAEQLPPQVAVSVTEVTGAQFEVANVEGSGTQTRNRWGRFYLPGGVVNGVSNGRLSSGYAEAIATACQTLYNSCVNAGILPVMYSPTTGNAWTVTDIHVDDIWDVIRSRRFETPLSRHSKHIDEP